MDTLRADSSTLAVVCHLVMESCRHMFLELSLHVRSSSQAGNLTVGNIAPFMDVNPQTCLRSEYREILVEGSHISPFYPNVVSSKGT
jgi:hypothetical protein